MQLVWESFIIIMIFLFIFCLIGFTMNDILEDIREQKKNRKAKENMNNEILKHKMKKTKSMDNRYLRAVK